MQFSTEPTAQADEIAAYVRQWYEANRETWWNRHEIGMLLTGHAPGATPDRDGTHADEFMLRFVAEVNRVQAVARQQDD